MSECWCTKAIFPRLWHCYIRRSSPTSIMPSYLAVQGHYMHHLHPPSVNFHVLVTHLVRLIGLHRFRDLLRRLLFLSLCWVGVTNETRISASHHAHSHCTKPILDAPLLGQSQKCAKPVMQYVGDRSPSPLSPYEWRLSKGCTRRSLDVRMSASGNWPM